MLRKVCVVFDLDDTLYKEIDFLRSAYNYIAGQLCDDGITAALLANKMYQMYCNKQDVFGYLQEVYPTVSKSQLLDWYRSHIPIISLDDDTFVLLEWLKLNSFKMGIITDGRSITQRNKILALGLNQYIRFKEIIISEEFGTEKPNRSNYQYFSQLFPGYSFVYIADNPKKDFVTPNQLGWKTIGLIDDGRNIHQQLILSADYQPNIWVNTLSQVVNILK